MKSSGTVDAGGTGKVLLRHRKDRIVLSKGYERKILVYGVVPYSQQYINASLTTLDNGVFSCGQNLSLNFSFNSTKYSKR